MKNQQNAKKNNKPLYVCQCGDTTVAVLPSQLRYGAITMRLQHEVAGKIRKLQCKIKVNRLRALDFTAPAGTVIAEAVDVISPEVCTELGYRNDGKGYTRILTATVLNDKQIQLMIVCTFCMRDDNSHICTVGQYSHIEKAILSKNDMQDMVNMVLLAMQAAQDEPKLPKEGIRL